MESVRDGEHSEHEAPVVGSSGSAPMTWSRFVETDTAKVATFVALVGILIVSRADLPHYLRLGQLVAIVAALGFVAVLAYRDTADQEPHGTPAECSR